MHDLELCLVGTDAVLCLTVAGSIRLTAGLFTRGQISLTISALC